MDCVDDRKGHGRAFATDLFISLAHYDATFCHSLGKIIQAGHGSKRQLKQAMKLVSSKAGGGAGKPNVVVGEEMEPRADTILL